MNTPKLNECFPEWVNGGGIFAALTEQNVPWNDPDDPFIPIQLDYAYHGNHSGDKLVSPLVRKIGEISTNPPVLDEYQKSVLAGMAVRMYGVNWVKEWATLSAEYNPIENYSMTETMTDDETVIEYGRTHTRTDNLSHTKTGTETSARNTTDTRTDNLSHAKTGTETTQRNTTDTRTDNLTHAKTGTETTQRNTTDTRTDNLTENINKSVNGFDGLTASPSESENKTNTGTETIAHTGSDTLTFNTTDKDTGTEETKHTGSDTLTFNTTDKDTGTQAVAHSGSDTLTFNTTDADTGTQADVDSGSDTHTRNYELKRSGNIGVTTSQQMLQSERDLWVWNYFNDVVFPDLDKILTCPIY